MIRRTTMPAAALVAVCVAVSARAHELEPGLYEISVRLELPNVVRSATTTVVKRCISNAEIEEHSALRIRSHTPLANCPTSPMCMGGGKVGFEVFCPGPDGGHARATFKATGSSFSGTIRMVMGGKNMTVIEHQDGRRIGKCDSGD